ncbi:MAG TPA: hypothetical protein VFV99_05820 [Kofleriaceae bacterium]|nr:hypothetical protein [Kofleriaceae bacterium]
MRSLDKRLLHAIRELARRERISLNKAALRLLERGAGLAPASQENRIGSSLDHLAGTWSALEAKAFEQALKSCEQIDEAMWK